MFHNILFSKQTNIPLVIFAEKFYSTTYVIDIIQLLFSHVIRTHKSVMIPR